MRTALVAAAAVALTGCSVDVNPAASLEHLQKSIDLDKSEMARVEIKMGAGDLRVEGGSPKFLDADFEYNIPSWKPVIRYDASSFRSDLLIEQSGSSHSGVNSTCKWDLHFNDKLPVDMVTNLGAGEAHLNLGSMSLRSLEVHMGVGQVELDLRGNPTRDYNVQIHGGIGQAIVHLPASVGIVATAAGGIGNIEVHGLEKRDGRWINVSHEHSPVTIHLDVKGGIGNITLTAE